MNDHAPDPPSGPPIDVLGVDPERLMERVVKSSYGSTDRWQPPTVVELTAMIDGYVARELIGQGGMGAVYAVTHENLDKECALKLLPPPKESRPDLEERFLQEARAMAKLSHPNILHIYDFGHTSEGNPYYVMELVDGIDLSEFIANGPLDPETAFNIVLKVCDGLEHAHRAGFIHRDIKPSNILVDQDTQVKVADFGLTKSTSGTPLVEGLTRTGEMIGTPGYMSPEQLKGRSIDERTDVFSVAVLLYELLTGSTPVGAHRAPSELIKCPKAVDHVIAKALTPAPKHRYQQIAEFRSALEDALTSSRRKQIISRTLGSIAAIAVIGAVSAAIISPPQKSDTLERLPIPRPGKPWTNSLGMKFVPVRGTTTLVSQWETRWADWEPFLEETSHRWPPQMRTNPIDHPAINISWNDATAYCEWLTEKERTAGRISDTMSYRLPTDQEWSAAAGLTHELGNSPAERNDKVSGVYPWGRQWPPPSAIAEQIDDSDAIAVMRIMRRAHDILSTPMDPNVLEELKILTFDAYKTPWRDALNQKSKSFIGLPEYIANMMVMATDQSVARHWNGKTVVMMGLWMGGHAEWANHHFDWQSADWTDPEFTRFFTSADWGGGEPFNLWTDTRWNDELNQWTRSGRALKHCNIGESGQLVVVAQDHTLTMEGQPNPSVVRVRPVLIFDGSLTEAELWETAASYYDKGHAMWRREASVVITEFLPRYEYDWADRWRSVSTGNANEFGITGLPGSAKEWVHDAFDHDTPLIKTMRGGSLRMRARGPSPDEINDSGAPLLDLALDYLVPPEIELLSSHRQTESSDVRRPWYGFRVVLSFDP